MTQRSPLLSANDIVEGEVLEETVFCRGRVRPASPEGAIDRGARLEPEVEPDRLSLLREDILEVIDVPVVENGREFSADLRASLFCFVLGPDSL